MKPGSPPISARALFDKAIENVRKEAERKGTSLLYELGYVSDPMPPKSGLAALLSGPEGERACVEMYRVRFYEYLIDGMLADYDRVFVKPREKRKLAGQLTASKKRVKAAEKLIEIIKAQFDLSRNNRRVTNKMIARHLGDRYSDQYVKKVLRKFEKEFRAGESHLPKGT